METGLNSPVVSIFVDDIKIIVTKKSGIIQQLKAELIAIFSIADIRPISFYLRLKIGHNQEKWTIKLFQPAYIDKILNKFYFNKAHLFIIPMKESALWEPYTKGQASIARKKIYQSITGFIIFSIIETKPNIIFATLIVVQFVKNLGY